MTAKAKKYNQKTSKPLKLNMSFDEAMKKALNTPIKKEKKKDKNK